MFRNALEVATSLLFPKVCESCKAVMSPLARMGMCDDCLSQLPKITPPFCGGCGRHISDLSKTCGQCVQRSFGYDRAYSAYYYDERVKELLHAFKFDKVRALDHLLADWLAQFYFQHIKTLHKIDAVTAVPMTRERAGDRGYNQALVLARQFSRVTGLTLLPEALLRKKSARIQSSLGKADRARNAHGSFVAGKSINLQAQHILLIDDIMTTGSTASECATALKSASANTVTVLTVARGF